MSLFTAAENEALLRATGGVVVTKGAESTYGHPKWTPVQVLEGEGGMGGVQTADARVVIAAGTLTGITAEGDGIDDTITVGGVSCTVIGIQPPDREDDGDLLELVLRKN